jgi:hypothetical protein
LHLAFAQRPSVIFNQKSARWSEGSCGFLGFGLFCGSLFFFLRL